MTQDCQLFFLLCGAFIGISGQNTELTRRKPSQSSSDSPVPADITAPKTIGAYTESISTGPELMQSQIANQQ